MSLLMPRAYSAHQTTNSVDSALNVEILEEKAASLGRAGKRVEKTLEALRLGNENDLMRPDLVRDAADAVYAYFIQRELCGLKDQDAAIKTYAIPAEVVAILGSK